MCGFIGKFSKNENIIEEIIEANKYNICRGPDDLKVLLWSLKRYFLFIHF